jgi:integrase
LDATISRLESLGKYGSASKHKSLRSRLSQYRTLNIRLDEIDLAFLRDFELFLRRIGNANNSIATKFAIFKAAYNRALAEEQFVTKSNPFSKFKVGSLWTKTRKRAITKEDVQKLMGLKIEPSHQTEYRDFARDVFLFSYFTAGINFTDISSLRYCDIVNRRISYSRNKTQKLLSFRLMPRALEIIEKYSRSGHSSDDYIFPILDRRIHVTPQQIFNRTHKTLRKINRELKVLGEMIGLQIPLTTYVARHTYATVLKRSGVNIAIISESLGHSDLSTTQIYLDSFENSQIDEAMKNLL